MVVKLVNFIVFEKLKLGASLLGRGELSRLICLQIIEHTLKKDIFSGNLLFMAQTLRIKCFVFTWNVENS